MRARFRAGGVELERVFAVARVSRHARSVRCARSVLAAASVAVALAASPASGQVAPSSAREQMSAGDAFAENTFEDPVARALLESARTNWMSLDESILRYSARIQQRIAAAIRTPLKDRVLYRSEVAVRAFWDRDYDPVVQVLASNSQYPGRMIAMEEEDFDWLEDFPFDEPFDPGGDRLFFGASEASDADRDSGEQDVDVEFAIAHPLAIGADSLYRYASGDTLTLTLPDGRELITVQLDVLPRVADVRRISGTLWIEPRSGALVRAVYRLSQQFDAIRDVPDLQEEEEDGSFRYVPGIFKPWTFDLTMIAIDYALWDFEVWLPRSMRVEGEVAAGILKMPVSMDVAYDVESVVTTASEEALSTPGQPDLIERHFESRAEAMAFIAELLSRADGIEYEPAGDERSGRDQSFLIAPEDRSVILNSIHLPPPIWEDAAGFPSEAQVADYVTTLAQLPSPTIQGLPWQLNWGWAREDLLRFNRVEGPAIGGRFEAKIGGPYTLQASGFFGFADLQPKVRLEVERSSVRRRLALGGYRDLTATNPRGRYLGLGNSLYAFLFGRDDGEYYRRTGVDLRWRPPVGARDSRDFRLYVERQEAVGKEIDFSVTHALSSGWRFRPNLAADDVEEAGAELRLSPWSGGDPFGTQIGLEVYGQGAIWRPVGSTETSNFARASATLRVAGPILRPAWRLGVEFGAGTTWGTAPVQRQWFIGGAHTLRGYAASSAMGTSFARGRIEVARTWDVGTASLFHDIGWAGSRRGFDLDQALYSIGVGGSVLDGLIRMDLSHGLRGVQRQFRFDLYLDALL